MNRVDPATVGDATTASLSPGGTLQLSGLTTVTLPIATNLITIAPSSLPSATGGAATAAQFVTGTPSSSPQASPAAAKTARTSSMVSLGKLKGPQCKVCNDEASGYHYGVDSCEGCKGFFRRCITQGMNHRCSNDEKCEITPFSRNSCQYCRLKKCFMVGMSREASRLGRRPKRLKEASEQNNQRSHHLNPPSIAPYPNGSTSSNNNTTQPTSSSTNPFTLQTVPSSFVAVTSLSREQICRLSMAELQRLITSIQAQGKTVNLPPDIYKTIIKTEPPTPPAATATTTVVPTIQPQPEPPGSADSESGYSSFGGDTPSGSTSHSPVANPAAIPQATHVEIKTEIPFIPQQQQQQQQAEPMMQMQQGGMEQMMDGIIDSVVRNMPSPTTPVPATLIINGLTDMDMNSINDSLSQSPSLPLQPPPLVEDIMQVERTSPTEFIRKRKAQIKQESHVPTLVSGACNLPPPILPQQQQEQQQQQFNNLALPYNLGSIELHLRDAKMPPNREKMTLIDQVIETVVEAHLTTCNYTSEKVAFGVKKYEQLKAAGQIPQPPSGMMGMMGGGGGMMASMMSSMANGSGMPNCGMMGNGMMNGGSGMMNGGSGMMNGGMMNGGMMNGGSGMADMASMMMGGGGGPAAGGAGPPHASKMWDQFVQNMVPVITRVVKFSKRLPGFTELGQDDQIKLIKQGSFEVVLTRYTPLFDDGGMFIPSMEIKIPRHMVKVMPMGTFFSEQFKFAHIFNPLGLEDGEVGLLTAIMIMCPDRKNLDNKKAVYKLQGLFLQSLYQYMKRLRPDNHADMFHRAINTLPLLRQINDSHAKQLNSMNINTPQLHKEVFDLQSSSTATSSPPPSS